jgi:hypothetical protein
MNRTRIRSMAGIVLLAIMTAFASGCYYYGYDYPEYYARRDWRYDRYYDRRYDPRYNRYYDSRYYDGRYGWRYGDRYYDNRTARVWRDNNDRYSD